MRGGGCLSRGKKEVMKKYGNCTMKICGYTQKPIPFFPQIRYNAFTDAPASGINPARRAADAGENEGYI